MLKKLKLSAFRGGGPQPNTLDPVSCPSKGGRYEERQEYFRSLLVWRAKERV
jgi:hypothetical protein